MISCGRLWELIPDVWSMPLKASGMHWEWEFKRKTSTRTDGTLRSWRHCIRDSLSSLSKKAILAMGKADLMTLRSQGAYRARAHAPSPESPRSNHSQSSRNKRILWRKRLWTNFLPLFSHIGNRINLFYIYENKQMMFNCRLKSILQSTLVCHCSKSWKAYYFKLETPLFIILNLKQHKGWRNFVLGGGGVRALLVVNKVK